MLKGLACVLPREEKREAVSEFLPSVTISGYKSSQDSFDGNLA